MLKIHERFVNAREIIGIGSGLPGGHDDAAQGLAKTPETD
jgi:hypothetical protein